MKPYFEGWYYKQQASNGRTLALIPGKSADSAFIQVITDNESFNIPFGLSEYRKSDVLRVGGNEFSESGVSLCINRNKLSLSGELRYNKLTPIKGDIMGPFRFFPMECRHGIVSMRHGVDGEVELNGEKLNFNNGTGYIETDSGYSFPESYSWVHSNDFMGNCSVMASVAKIPFAGFSFWGCVCVVWLNGKEYRLATYKGAKILRCEPGRIELKQGGYYFSMAASQRNARSLAAPRLGSMSRIITESASCPAEFTFRGGGVNFYEASERASYEYAF